MRACVDVVHRTPTTDDLSAQYLKEFDAYYNPATNRVIDNGWRNGDIPAQYRFGKYMAVRGFPLGTP